MDPRGADVVRQLRQVLRRRTRSRRSRPSTSSSSALRPYARSARYSPSMPSIDARPIVRWTPRISVGTRGFGLRYDVRLLRDDGGAAVSATGEERRAEHARRRPARATPPRDRRGGASCACALVGAARGTARLGRLCGGRTSGAAYTVRRVATGCNVTLYRKPVVEPFGGSGLAGVPGSTVAPS